jgi:hypothetical protein
MRMAVVLFVVVLLISLVATVSYLAGRVLTPVEAAPSPVAALLGAVTSTSSSPLVIDAPVPASPPAPVPPGATRVDQAAQTETTPPAPRPRKSAQTSGALSPPRPDRATALLPAPRLTNSGSFSPAQPEWATALPPAPRLANGGSLWPAQPDRGLYLQVSATTLGMAQALTQTIRRAGFDARIAPGPSERIVRVVIGPLAPGEQIAQTQTALAAGGYEYFLRRF